MDLLTAILGLLSWKPSSGYDLKRIISDSDIFYWSGNNNQIYKSLLELQKDGLVSHQGQLLESLHAKKVYPITEKGMTALCQSIMEKQDVLEVHKRVLTRL